MVKRKEAVSAIGVVFEGRVHHVLVTNPTLAELIAARLKDNGYSQLVAVDHDEQEVWFYPADLPGIGR